MEPHHPRKGTVMVGAMCGYYEPERDEYNDMAASMMKSLKLKSAS